MHNYDIVFQKVKEISAEEQPGDQQEATAQELDDIEELRRFTADLRDPEPCSFTTT